MVVRADIDQLIAYRKACERKGYDSGQVILWDTADVTDLMPLTNKPIENLPEVDGVLGVLMSLRRRVSPDTTSLAQIHPDDGVDLEAPPGSEESTRVMPGKRRTVPTAEEHTLYIDRQDWSKMTLVAFIPGSVRFESGGLINVTGRVDYNDHGNHIGRPEITFTGYLWSDTSKIIIGRDADAVRRLGTPLPTDEQHLLEMLWTSVCAWSQNVLWCVTHPTDFPIYTESAATTTHHREHIKVAKKAKLDLTQVRVIGLRPQVKIVHSAAADTGEVRHRNFRYAFFVRGHFRHHANGTVSWVNGYWKALDKPKITRETVPVF